MILVIFPMKQSCSKVKVYKRFLLLLPLFFVSLHLVKILLTVVLLLQEDYNISCTVVLLALNFWFWFEKALHLFLRAFLLGIVKWDFCVYCCFIADQLKEKHGSHFLSLLCKARVSIHWLFLKVSICPLLWAVPMCMRVFVHMCTGSIILRGDYLPYTTVPTVLQFGTPLSDMLHYMIKSCSFQIMFDFGSSHVSLFMPCHWEVLVTFLRN